MAELGHSNGTLVHMCPTTIMACEILLCGIVRVLIPQSQLLISLPYQVVL